MLKGKYMRLLLWLGGIAASYFNKEVCLFYSMWNLTLENKYFLQRQAGLISSISFLLLGPLRNVNFTVNLTQAKDHMSHISRLFRQTLTFSTYQHCSHPFALKQRRKSVDLSPISFFRLRNNFSLYISYQRLAVFAPWRSQSSLANTGIHFLATCLLWCFYSPKVVETLIHGHSSRSIRLKG